MIDIIMQLRHHLHNCAEISGKEEKTKALLMNFLKNYTTLELHPCGKGFYAAHREKNAVKPAIALRADYDALVMPDGTASHLCGHDGHAAALCGAALMAEGKTFDRNIFFLFQPAEETGAGAEPCCELFQKETVDEIYGAHNLPGVPFGQVTTRPGTFACASRGITLVFKGKPAHAAYPENGISPAAAVGKLLCEIPILSAPEKYTGMTLCTVIGVEMGEKAFGAAAEKAVIWLTLRAEHDHDLTALHDSILQLSETLAQEYHLDFSYEMQDVFPATENHPENAEKVLTLTNGTLLEVPMRWSEDFGHYLQHCKGAFFGIGAGKDHPPLHTEHYEYPDRLLQPAMEVFYKLMES
ncbi:amidohydrolase [Anaerotignum sp.]